MLVLSPYNLQTTDMELSIDSILSSLLLLFGDSMTSDTSKQKNTSLTEINVFQQETHVRHRSPEQQCLMIKRLIISISIYKMVLISKQISSFLKVIYVKQLLLIFAIWQISLI